MSSARLLHKPGWLVPFVIGTVTGAVLCSIVWLTQGTASPGADALSNGAQGAVAASQRARFGVDCCGRDAAGRAMEREAEQRRRAYYGLDRRAGDRP